MTRTRIEDDPVELGISPEKVVFLIEKAKEFDVKDAPTKGDPGSNASDDGMIEVLEDHPDDPVLEEITGLIGSLNEDEQIELVALMWLGREDYDAKEWEQAKEDSAAAHNNRTGRYLAGTPLLADFLASGLDKLGYPVAELEAEAF